MTFAPEWLRLREPADAAARSTALADAVGDALAGRRPLTIHDMGCGTGAMGRWLAGRLGGEQKWVLHDHDPRLLEVASSAMSALPEVSVEVRAGDVTALRAADIAGADLVTCSAVLDLLTAEEVNALAAACMEARVPALFTLSVAGRVDLDPAEPLDALFQAAFNAHQRRVVAGRRLLGPDAPAAVEAAFTARGASVRTAPSPWRLHPGALQTEWLTGWVGAAVEQQPDLAAAASAYLLRRSSARVVVHHIDLLALPEAA